MYAVRGFRGLSFEPRMRSGDHCYGPPRTRSIADGVSAQKNSTSPSRARALGACVGRGFMFNNVHEADAKFLKTCVSIDDTSEVGVSVILTVIPRWRHPSDTACS